MYNNALGVQYIEQLGEWVDIEHLLIPSIVHLARSKTPSVGLVKMDTVPRPRPRKNPAMPSLAAPEQPWEGKDRLKHGKHKNKIDQEGNIFSTCDRLDKDVSRSMKHALRGKRIAII